MKTAFIKDVHQDAMLKELKNGVTMSHQIENINRETEIIKTNQVGILELKSTTTKMKNSLRGSTVGMSWQNKASMNLNAGQ